MPKSCKTAKRRKLLSSTRPSLATPFTISNSTTSKPSTPSSKHTRTTIRSHHVLQKRLSQALSGLGRDSAEVRDLERQLDQSGGLREYQKASTTGQGKERGGDASEVLVTWLGLERDGRRKRKRGGGDRKDGEGESATAGELRKTERGSGGMRLRVLEIGCLSPHNAISTCTMPTTTTTTTNTSSSSRTGTSPSSFIPATQVRRIDLRSTHPLIEERDFMTMNPQEIWKGQRGYDVVSLSLVLNYVGDGRGRGEMLRHTTKFLRRRPEGLGDGAEIDGGRGREIQAQGMDTATVVYGRKDEAMEDCEEVGQEDGMEQEEYIEHDADHDESKFLSDENLIEEEDDDDDTEEWNGFASPPSNNDASTTKHTNSRLHAVTTLNSSSSSSTSNATATTLTLPRSTPPKIRHPVRSHPPTERHTRHALLPSLFLSLPLPTVQNSRYLTSSHLVTLMSSLGYTQTREKRTGKMYYSLWRYDGSSSTHTHTTTGTATGTGTVTYQSKFKKREINPGVNRNNFCIILD